MPLLLPSTGPDIVLRGLDWPAQALRDLTFDLPTPGLDALLAAGNLVTALPPVDTLLAAALAPDQAAGSAPYRVAGLGGEPGHDRWLCLDPAVLELGDLTARARTLPDSALTQDEANTMAVDLAPAFAGLGDIVVSSPCRWHLRLAAGAPTLPLADGVDAAAMALRLPTRWQVALNEAQMILHAHPANRARADAGQVVVNTLHLWGEGALPATPDGHGRPCRYTEVQSVDCLLRGKARSDGVSVATPDFAAAMGGTHTTLIVLDHLLDAAATRDANTWREAMQRLDKEWLSPLAAAWRDRKIATATCWVPVEKGLRCVTLTPPTFGQRLLAPWRRRPGIRGIDRLIAT